jgi:hypothetical protein
VTACVEAEKCKHINQVAVANRATHSLFISKRRLTQATNQQHILHDLSAKLCHPLGNGTDNLTSEFRAHGRIFKPLVR